jgi:hypothetical protein
MKLEGLRRAVVLHSPALVIASVGCGGSSQMPIAGADAALDVRLDACALEGDCNAGQEWDALACACVPVPDAADAASECSHPPNISIDCDSGEEFSVEACACVPFDSGPAPDATGDRRD